MGLFRRNEETLNEQLLREAELDQPHAQVPPPGPSSIYVPRVREWDVSATATAPGVEGSDVEFVSLPGGDLIVETEQGDADLSPLADAVEKQLKPPYRARGNRLSGDLWGVTADPIDVRQFTCDAGDEIEVVSRDGDVTVTVDGQPSDIRIPELAQDWADYAVHASRIDGDYWEAEAHPL
jgi:hypothetical protein